MKDTNLPGFTAEASLYKTEKHYTVQSTETISSTPVVVPQYGYCDKAAYYCNRGYQNWCDGLEKFCFND